MGAKHDVRLSEGALWAEAEKIFRKSVKNVDKTVADNKVTIKRAIKDIKRSSHVHGRIPGILEQLQRFLNFGDNLMVAAPETVSLAWMGFSLIGKQSKLRSVVESTAQQMFDVIGVCEAYAQRYLRGAVKDALKDVESKVRNQIPQLLSVVLKFSYLAQKYFAKGKFEQALENILGQVSAEFQDAADEAAQKLELLRKTATMDFEGTILEILEKIRSGQSEKMEKIVLQEFKENTKTLSKKISDLDSPRERHLAILKTRHPASCRWILEDEKFKSWSKNQSGLLWLRGAGGFGKSVLMSTVIEEFEKQSTGSGSVILLYFFCKLGNTTSENGTKIMMHLCAQLFAAASETRAKGSVELRKACNTVLKDTQGLLKDSKMGPHMKVSDIRVLFQELYKVFQKPIIVAIDGLDECEDLGSSGFMSALKSLAKSATLRVRVIVSSRPANHIQSFLKEAPCVEVNHEKTKQDIIDYVAGSLQKHTPWGEQKREKVAKQIAKKSDGQFQYASSVIERIKKDDDRFMDAEEFIASLPETTNGLYRQKIEAMNDKERRVLVIALRWLTCGRETMDLLPIAEELYRRYEGDNDVNDFDESKSVQLTAESLEKIGRDFLRVSSKTVLLEHNSVRDFVNSNGNTKDKISVLMLQAEKREGSLLIAETIVQRLNSRPFRKAYLTPNQPPTKVRYEVKNLFRHLREAEDAWSGKRNDREHSKRSKALLDAVESFMRADNQVYYRSLLEQTNRSKEAHDDHMLHTSSRHGLVSLMERLLNENHLPGYANSHKNTPLHLVCLGRGYFRGLDLLLDKKRSVNLNLRNKDGATPLLLAVQNAVHTRPVKSLLNRGADPTIPDKSGATCLHHAAAAHNTELCHLLLNHRDPKVEVNAEDESGETPLHWACKGRHAPKDFVKLFLDHKADVNAQDADSQAPLYEACRVGNLEVARLLLERGADIHDDDVRGDTALHAAVHARDLEIVKLLARHNASKVKFASGSSASNTKLQKNKPNGENRDTPSASARPLDLFKRNSKGQDALACAATYNQQEILLYLLDVYQERRIGHRTLLKPEKGGTIPLHHCVAWGNEKGARKLMEVGNGKEMCRVANGKGNQALHIAATRGISSTTKLLLEYEAPTDARGFSSVWSKFGEIPLDAAFRGWQEMNGIDTKTQRRFEETIETLFHKTEKIEGREHKLHCALFRGSTRVCRLFEAEWSVKDKHDWTGRMLAAAYKFDLSDETSSAPSQMRTRSPSKWLRYSKSSVLKFSDDDLSVLFKPVDGSTVARAVRTNHPVPYETKKFYFTIEIEEGEIGKSMIAVGFCTELAYSNQLPGSKAAHAHTWGYHGDTGHKFARFSSGQPYGSKFGKGDIIGCCLDYTQGFGKGIISFAKNGKELGRAFDKVKGQLFPTVGFAGGAEAKVRLSFTTSDDWKGGKKVKFTPSTKSGDNKKSSADKKNGGDKKLGGGKKNSGGNKSGAG